MKHIQEMTIHPEMVERLKQTDFDCVIYSGIVPVGSCLEIREYRFRDLLMRDNKHGEMPMPSAWDVLDWLRTSHGLHVATYFERKKGEWCWCIYRLWSLGHRNAEERMLKTPVLTKTCEQSYPTWEQACRAGIEAAMNRL